MYHSGSLVKNVLREIITVKLIIVGATAPRIIQY